MIYQNQRGTLFTIFGEGTYRLLNKRPESEVWEPIENVRNCRTDYSKAVRDLAYLAEVFGLEKVDE